MVWSSVSYWTAQMVFSERQRAQEASTGCLRQPYLVSRVCPAARSLPTGGLCLQRLKQELCSGGFQVSSLYGKHRRKHAAPELLCQRCKDCDALRGTQVALSRREQCNTGSCSCRSATFNKQPYCRPKRSNDCIARHTVPSTKPLSVPNTAQC